MNKKSILIVIIIMFILGGLFLISGLEMEDIKVQKEGTMRVAVYNQMFGLNGENLFSFLTGHWKVHFQRLFRKNISANLGKTIEIINKSKADVIGIAEVLEGQEKELTEELSDLGYNYVFYEKGHKTMFRDLYIEVAIASKIPCEKINISGFPVKNEMGGGGGIVHCYLPSLQTHVINLHLASVKKEVYIAQLDFVDQYVQNLEEKVILLGDFNVPYKEIGDRFDYLDLVSNKIKTCPTTFGLKFLSKDLDHIFVRGYEGAQLEELIGYSDHKLIYVDLK